MVNRIKQNKKKKKKKLLYGSNNNNNNNNITNNNETSQLQATTTFGRFLLSFQKKTNEKKNQPTNLSEKKISE